MVLRSNNLLRIIQVVRAMITILKRYWNAKTPVKMSSVSFPIILLKSSGQLITNVDLIKCHLLLLN